MDQAVTRWINMAAGREVLLDGMMVGLSQFGLPLLVLFVILQWWSKDDRLRVRHACVAAGLSFLFGLLLNQFILLFVHRVRPYDAGLTHLIVSRSADWSFPSDHATASVAIAAAFLLHGFGRRGFAFLVAASLICVSRVYIGTHYVTDILGGAATAAAAALIMRAAYREGSAADRFVTGIL